MAKRGWSVGACLNMEGLTQTIVSWPYISELTVTLSLVRRFDSLHLVGYHFGVVVVRMYATLCQAMVVEISSACFQCISNNDKFAIS